MRRFIKLFLLFFFVSSCFLDKPPRFFKKKENCEIREKSFYRKERASILKKAEICLKEKKIKSAALILEQLLKRDRTTNRPSEEIKALTKKLAKISFYQLKNYDKALKHFTALLSFSLNPRESFSTQYSIAKSFYYLKKYSQALMEVEKAFSEKNSIEERKKAFLLKAWIFVAQGELNKAISLLRQQMKEHPDHQDFFREYLVFVYESQKNFLLAIQELEKIEKPTPFILNQIERLKERQKNQPGF